MLLSDMKADKPKQEDNDKAMHHMQNVGRLPTGRAPRWVLLCRNTCA